MKKKVFFWILLLFFPLLILAGLEGACRLVKFYSPARFPTYFDGQILEGLGSAKGRKEGGEYRIFILGSSAAFGVPDPRYSIAAWLRKSFPHLIPDRDVKVVNFAWPGKASRHVLEAARVALAYRPHLFILYCGNNEYLTSNRLFVDFPFYSADLRAYYSSLFYRFISNRFEQLRNKLTLGRWESQERTYREEVLAKKVYKTSVVDEEAAERILSHYEKNIRAILRLAQKHGIDATLLTVPSNVRDFAPYASSHRRSLNAEQLQTWEKYFKDGQRLEKEGKIEAALRHYERARAIDPTYAEVQYRLAVCYERLGRYAEAKKGYEDALDYDRMCLRAQPRLNKILRKIAGDHPEVLLIDFAGLLEKSAPAGILSQEFFHDTVHPLGEVNRRITGEILKTLASRDKIVPSKDWKWKALKTAQSKAPAVWETEDKKSADSSFIRGLMHWHQKDYGKVVEDLNEGLHQNPAYLEGWFFLADAYYHLNQRGESWKAFKRIEAADPSLLQNLLGRYPEIQSTYSSLTHESLV